MPRITGYGRLTTQQGGSHPAPMAAHDAARFFTEKGIEHGPVSGDQTLRYHGIRGWLMAEGPLIWRGPSVRPTVATTGIRAGDTIETWFGTGIVTAVGSIAGWYEVEGKDRRWEIGQVLRITPATTT